MMQLLPPFILSFAFQALSTEGHSWVENAQKIDTNDQYAGRRGYIRNYTGHFDDQATQSILSDDPNQPFCSPFQEEQFQANGFPRLSARPGSRIIAQYLENGHISAPVVPDSVVGNIYWFGSDENISGTDNITFGEVQAWKEVPGRGKLLNVTPFDDGKCGRGDLALPCHSTFRIPWDAVVGSVYRVYWLWNYSGKLGRNIGHTEFYTSCMDIDITP